MKKRILSLVLMLCMILTMAPLAAASEDYSNLASIVSGFWREETTHPGFYIYHVYDIWDASRTWEEANQFCEDSGILHLVTITSQEEQQFVTSLLTGNKGNAWSDTNEHANRNNEPTKNGYWMGGHADTNHTWKWVTEENFTYSNWDEGEPNNYRSRENAMLIINQENGSRTKWNDMADFGDPGYDYDVKNIGFITEYEWLASPNFSPPIVTTDWNGHTYLVCDESMTWEEAKQHCEKVNGHLATITSEEEQKVIEDLLKQGELSSYWLGAAYQNGSFQWITGENFSYNNWEPGQPDGRQNDMYVQIYNTLSNKNQYYGWDDTWNAGDHTGGLKNQGFICEFEEIIQPISQISQPSENEQTILKAKKIVNNHYYQYYKETDVPHTIMDNVIGDASLMEKYYTLTEDVLNGKSTNFYEIILFDVLIENIENKELLTNIADTIEENAVTTFVNACSEMYDDTLGDNYYMTAEFLDGAIDDEKLILTPLTFK